MAKSKSYFECQLCGRHYSRWEGRCSECNSWNSIIEVAEKESKTSSDIGTLSMKKLSEISLSPTPRISTLSSELDRVLGGGFIKGEVILLGGEPGIGKSTLLLELASRVANHYKEKVLYISGEESMEQIKIRAHRLNINSEHIIIASETSLLKSSSLVQQEKPFIAIIDSIQAIQDENLNSPTGSFSHLRQTVSTLVEIAKGYNVPTFLIGHVTKEGMIAGPKLIEHMVDAVIYFEGDDNLNYRLLRTVKNRFGATNEIGIFEMRDKGLVDVQNPSSFFIAGHTFEKPGSTIGCMLTGTRPILVEIQALLASSFYASPRRNVVGYDLNRVAMLLAVMEKRLHYDFSNQDVFVNIVGGLKAQEPSIDLSVVVSLASIYLQKPLKEDYVFFGEVGLTGELRNITRITDRIAEARRAGFKNVVIPAQGLDFDADVGVIMVKTIEEVLNVIFD